MSGEYVYCGTCNATTNHYCTIVGHEYLIKLLAFHRSLCNRSRPFQLYVLCIDDMTYSFLQRAALPNVILNQLWEVEDGELLSVKWQRKTNEYCWTLKPVYIEFILTRLGASNVLYCDSDVFMFADPQPIFHALHNCSIYLCPQRDIPEVEWQYGKYQAGVIGFSNTYEGLAALRYWRAKCIEQCSAEPVGDTFGDQKYLDALPSMYGSVYCESHLGVDAAPWNCVYHNTDWVNIRGGVPYIGNDELIAFHFATMLIFSDNEYDLWSYGTVDMPNRILGGIYTPYIEALREAIGFITGIDAWYANAIFANKWPSQAATYHKYDAVNKNFFLHDEFYTLCAIVSETYVTRAMALYSSLKRHQDNFHIWFCAVDDTAYWRLQQLGMQNATILHVRDLQDQSLLNASYNRKLHEFCWTLKACLIQYLFTQFHLKRVLYLDSDLYLFAPLQYIYQEWHTYSFMMCTQRATQEIEGKCGYYQAGLIGVKNDHYGLRVLNWWKDRCLEWCYDDYNDPYGRWGDQKYLERVPHDFENIKVITNVGINAAPWNLILNDIGYIVTEAYGHVFINNAMLCAYHFGSIGIHEGGGYDVWTRDPVTPKGEVMWLIYQPYFAELDRCKDILNSGMGGALG